MATRFYLHVATADDPPTTGEKSSALPVGTGNSNSGTGFDDLSMNTTIGASLTSKTLASLAQTAHQDGMMARFTSPSLAAQTITAQTWTCAFVATQNNGSANSAAVLSIYVWRPGTSSVVGYVYDSDTPLGSDEWEPTALRAWIITASGAEVTAQAGDVLVFEFWHHASQSKATSYTQTLYFDGTSSTFTNNVDNTDPASYLETPQDLTFGGGGAPNLRRYTLTTTGVG